MKQFTLIALATLLAGAHTAKAQQAQYKRMHTAPVSAVAGVKTGKSAVKNAATTPRRIGNGTEYLPKTQTEYTYVNGRWVNSGTYSFTYNELGLPKTIDYNDGETLLRTERTYTADGQLATETTSLSEDNGATFTPSEKKEQTYDPIFPQLTLTKDKYIWTEDSGWQPNYDSFHRAVVRNTDNNVTSLTLAVPYMGTFEETLRITNTFNGETKKAETFQLEELNQSGEWSRTQFLRNLTWKETNGQLVDQYDLWMNYGNKLQSGTIADNDPTTGEMVDFGFINIAYKDNGADYVETIDYTDVLSRSVTSLETTDNYGSYTYIYKYYEDTDNDNNLDSTEITGYNRESGTYDAHGNMTLNEQYEINSETGEEELTGATRYEYTYDAAHGDAEKELVMSEYDYDKKRYTPTMKISTTEYTMVTAGIHNLNADKDETCAVYNMQGVNANGTASKGIYIIKKNGKSLKVAR